MTVTVSYIHNNVCCCVMPFTLSLFSFSLTLSMLAPAAGFRGWRALLLWRKWFWAFFQCFGKSFTVCPLSFLRLLPSVLLSMLYPAPPANNTCLTNSIDLHYGKCKFIFGAWPILKNPDISAFAISILTVLFLYLSLAKSCMWKPWDLHVMNTVMTNKYRDRTKRQRVGQ